MATLFVKFKSEEKEQELKGEYVDFIEFLKKNSDSIEYVVLEFDDGESLEGQTVEAVQTYCEFWNGVE